jgi:NitT/TauT family transport system permease protein
LAKTLSVALALLLWQILSIAVADKLLLVSPIDVIKRLSEMIFEKEFISASLFTFKRIALGFLSGVVVGTALALTAGRFKFVETLLWPYMITVKSVPVASFVVIALLWINGANLSFLISFLMVLPIIYTNILEGVHSVDEKMLEMAEVFKMPFSSRLRFIWLPSLRFFALSGCKIAVGLAWKSGVAAELIGYPKGSIGEALYYSKLWLETADLFAWTVVIVVVSVVFEKLFVFLLEQFFKGAENV